MTTRFATLLLISLAGFAPKIILALPPIANAPPPFRIYDVDRREQEMRRLISHGEGTPALSRPAADAALGRLDNIKRQEDVLRDRHGGRLTLSTIRKVDAELNALSTQLQGGSRMRESRTYGSVRGALSNGRPCRNP